MSVFFVFQGETYSQERNGGYVWSPQFTKSGKKNIGYTTMTDIRQNDFILHSSNGRILSISIALNDCYKSNQPEELAKAKTSTDWNKEGYRVDVEYHDFNDPLDLKSQRKWLASHYIKDSAFNLKGNGNQRYMCHLADEHAIHFLEAALPLQESPDLKKVISGALEEIAEDNDPEYDPLEKELINESLSDIDDQNIPEWTGKREKQALTKSDSTGNNIPKRDPKRAADALLHAKYKCEYNPLDRTFLRKNGKPYTEPHHLIPISKYKDFDYSVDVIENIVSLCSHCHNLLHYGRIEDKIPLLKKLYDERIDALKKCGLVLSFEQLKSYYE